MFFPFRVDEFSGILRRYKNRGYPKIELFPSSTYEDYVAENVIGIKNSHSHWVSSANDKDPYFGVRIVSGVLRITNYSIRSHNANSGYMRAWTFEGSNDNVSYTVLDDKLPNDDLNSSRIGQYKINEENNFYQYFRINQTNTTGSDYKMRISDLDFYGEFLPFKLNSCRYSRKNNYNMLLFTDFMLNS